MQHRHFTLTALATLFLGCLLLVLPLSLQAKEPKLKMHDMMPVWGGSCQPGGSVVVAGSQLFISVGCSADQPREPLKPGWPEGYALEAAMDLAAGQPFVPTPGLAERLEPFPYWSAINRSYQRSLETGKGMVDLRLLNLREFVLSIPEDLAGHSLTLRATYRKQGVELASKPSRPYVIVAPCDATDRARIIATRIYGGVATLEYRQAVALADSMLTAGLSDATAWQFAGVAASGSKQFDKALVYLDRLYNDFGVSAVELGTTTPPVLNRQGPRDPEVRAEYLRRREGMLQMKTAADREQQPQQERR